MEAKIIIKTVLSASAHSGHFSQRSCCPALPTSEAVPALEPRGFDSAHQWSDTDSETVLTLVQPETPGPGCTHQWQALALGPGFTHQQMDTQPRDHSTTP